MRSWSSYETGSVRDETLCVSGKNPVSSMIEWLGCHENGHRQEKGLHEGKENEEKEAMPSRLRDCETAIGGKTGGDGGSLMISISFVPLNFRTIAHDEFSCPGRSVGRGKRPSD